MTPSRYVAVRGLPLALALVFTSFAPGVRAQDAPPLCSDRPGDATPTCVLEAGAVQLETSIIDWSRSKGDGTTNSYLLGDSLLKLGIGGDTEVRASFTPYQHSRTTRERFIATSEGFGDVGLSARHRFVDGGSSGISFAGQAFVVLPTGSDEVSAGTWSAGIVAPVEFALGNGFNFNLTPLVAAQADSDGDGRHLLYSGTVAVGHALGSNVSMTGELFAQRDRDPAGHAKVVTANALLAWQPTPDLQFDLSTYVGLNSDAPDIEVLVGFTRRFR
ncbi:transporter [Croceicoccus sp. F390]|uniref:Transporter n=1 Tax=Croceicoccus esteveae TaxID=3075597 RepID=A0ABU2ZKH5_9SPHN|nr:transporter [Croceicoccus sp. F390]MDT0577108.1 transporter [Croceicoccus sp. F390]